MTNYTITISIPQASLEKKPVIDLAKKKVDMVFCGNIDMSWHTIPKEYAHPAFHVFFATLYSRWYNAFTVHLRR